VASAGRSSRRPRGEIEWREEGRPTTAFLALGDAAVTLRHYNGGAKFELSRVGFQRSNEALGGKARTAISRLSCPRGRSHPKGKSRRSNIRAGHTGSDFPPWRRSPPQMPGEIAVRGRDDWDRERGPVGSVHHARPSGKHSNTFQGLHAHGPGWARGPNADL